MRCYLFYVCVPALLIVMEVRGTCTSGRGQGALPLPEGEGRWRRGQVEGPLTAEEGMGQSYRLRL